MGIITRSMTDNYQKYIPDSVEGYLPLVDTEGCISNYANSCMSMDFRQKIEGLIHLKSTIECKVPTLLYLTYSLFIRECNEIMLEKASSRFIEDYIFDVALTFIELFTSAAVLDDDDVVYTMFYFAIEKTVGGSSSFWDNVMEKIEEIYSMNVSSIASIRTLTSM